MKTLGRILIILVTFALVMGITYVAMNAISSSTTVRSFGRGGVGSPRPESVQPQFPNGQRPGLPGSEGRGGGGMIHLILGTVRNIGLIAIIVVFVVWGKDFLERRKRTAQQATQ
jgi:hypothetical protein